MTCEPCPKTFSLSFFRASPAPRVFPRRLYTYTREKSAARDRRIPSKETPSIQLPLHTKATTPRSPIRSVAHRTART